MSCTGMEIKSLKELVLSFNLCIMEIKLRWLSLAASALPTLCRAVSQPGACVEVLGTEPREGLYH